MAERLDISPHLAQRVMVRRESVWLRIGALRASMNDRDGALEAYKSVLDCNPNNIHAMTQAGAALAKKECYPQAVTFLQNAVHTKPTCGEAWAVLAHCYVMTDDLNKAYDAYQRALNHLPNPRDPNLWYGIGLLYDRYGSLDNALEAFLAVLNIAPNFERAEEVCFCIGIIYKEQGKYDESLEYFNRSVASHTPQPPLTRADAWHHIGLVHELKGEVSSAIEIYHRVLSENPNHSKTLQQLGWLSHQQGNSSKAAELLDRSTQADPSDGQSWYLLGRLFMANREYRSAYNAYQQAVYRDGQNATFWCSIGVLYYQMQQHRDAMDAYTRAIRIDPKISEVWYDLGTLYESCNQISDATDAYRRAAELAPDNRVVTQRLAILQQAIATGVPPPPASAPTVADGPPIRTPAAPQSGQGAGGVSLLSGNASFPPPPVPANGTMSRHQTSIPAPTGAPTGSTISASAGLALHTATAPGQTGLPRYGSEAYPPTSGPIQNGRAQPPSQENGIQGQSLPNGHHAQPSQVQGQQVASHAQVQQPAPGQTHPVQALQVPPAESQPSQQADQLQVPAEQRPVESQPHGSSAVASDRNRVAENGPQGDSSQQKQEASQRSSLPLAPAAPNTSAPGEQDARYATIPQSQGPPSQTVQPASSYQLPAQPPQQALLQTEGNRNRLVQMTLGTNKSNEQAGPSPSHYPHQGYSNSQNTGASSSQDMSAQAHASRPQDVTGAHGVGVSSAEKPASINSSLQSQQQATQNQLHHPPATTMPGHSNSESYQNSSAHQYSLPAPSSGPQQSHLSAVPSHSMAASPGQAHAVVRSEGYQSGLASSQAQKTTDGLRDSGDRAGYRGESSNTLNAPESMAGYSSGQHSKDQNVISHGQSYETEKPLNAGAAHEGISNMPQQSPGVPGAQLRESQQENRQQTSSLSTGQSRPGNDPNVVTPSNTRVSALLTPQDNSTANQGHPDSRYAEVGRADNGNVQSNERTTQAVNGDSRNFSGPEVMDVGRASAEPLPPLRSTPLEQAHRGESGSSFRPPPVHEGYTREKSLNPSSPSRSRTVEAVGNIRPLPALRSDIPMSDVHSRNMYGEANASQGSRGFSHPSFENKEISGSTSLDTPSHPADANAGNSGLLPPLSRVSNRDAIPAVQSESNVPPESFSQRRPFEGDNGPRLPSIDRGPGSTQSVVVNNQGPDSSNYDGRRLETQNPPDHSSRQGEPKLEPMSVGPQPRVAGDGKRLSDEHVAPQSFRRGSISPGATHENDQKLGEKSIIARSQGDGALGTQSSLVNVHMTPSPKADPGTLASAPVFSSDSAQPCDIPSSRSNERHGQLPSQEEVDYKSVSHSHSIQRNEVPVGSSPGSSQLKTQDQSNPLSASRSVEIGKRDVPRSPLGPTKDPGSAAAGTIPSPGTDAANSQPSNDISRVEKQVAVDEGMLPALTPLPKRTASHNAASQQLDADKREKTDVYSKQGEEKFGRQDPAAAAMTESESGSGAGTPAAPSPTSPVDSMHGGPSENDARMERGKSKHSPGGPTLGNISQSGQSFFQTRSHSKSPRAGSDENRGRSRSPRFEGKPSSASADVEMATGSNDNENLSKRRDPPASKRKSHPEYSTGSDTAAVVESDAEASPTGHSRRRIFAQEREKEVDSRAADENIAKDVLVKSFDRSPEVLGNNLEDQRIANVADKEATQSVEPENTALPKLSPMNQSPPKRFTEPSSETGPRRGSGNVRQSDVEAASNSVERDNSLILRSPRGQKRPRPEAVPPTSDALGKGSESGKKQTGSDSTAVGSGGAALPPLRSAPTWQPSSKSPLTPTGSRVTSNGTPREVTAPASPAASRSSSERKMRSEYRNRDRETYRTRHREDRFRDVREQSDSRKERRRDWNTQGRDRERIRSDREREREPVRDWDRDASRDREWDRDRDYRDPRDRETNRRQYYNQPRR